MTTDQLNELGFYTLAGAPQSPAELLDEVAAAEALGLGSAFISERFNIKEAVTLSGAVAAVVVDARDRDGGDEPQHPPPDRDRVVRHDDAPAHRRPLHARARARHRAAVRRLRHPPHHDRAARGLRRAAAPPVRGRGRLRPRRPGREVPGPAPRLVVRRGHPASASSRSARTRSPSPAGRWTWWCCTRSSPTRRSSAACGPCGRRAEQRRPRSRRRCASGRATRRCTTACPTSSG